MKQLQVLERPQRVTEKSSISILKQLVEVSVSCITYIRGLLPESNYELKEFSDTKLKVLKKNFNKESDKLLNILELGVFDAIEKRYLRQMTLGIFADPTAPDTFLECYHFYMTYPCERHPSKVQIHNKEGALVTELNSMENIKQQSLRMMRSLVVLVQTLTDLPDNCFLTFRLLYYDEITPTNYEPKFFVHYEKEHTFPCTPKVKSLVGSINTPFHTMGMEVVSTCDELEPTQSQSQLPTTTTAFTHATEEKPSTMMPAAVKSTTDKIAELLEKTKFANSKLAQSSYSKPKPNPLTSLHPLPKQKPELLPQAEKGVKTMKSGGPCTMKAPTTPTSKPAMVTSSKHQETMDSLPPHVITKTRCICEFQEEDSGMVLCEQCLHWSHVVCWGFYHEKDPRVLSRPFFCHVCHPVDQFESKKMLALFRTSIAVSWNEMRTHWDAEKLAKRIKIPVSMARKLIYGMVENGMAEYVKVYKRKYYRMLKDTNQGKQAVKVYFNPDVFPSLPSILVTSTDLKDEETSFMNVPNTQDTHVLESNDEEDEVVVDKEKEDPLQERQGVLKASRKSKTQIEKPTLKRKITKESRDVHVNKKCKMSAMVEPISVT